MNTHQNSGWIPVDRNIFNHWTWQIRPYSEGQALIYLGLAASHKETSFVHGKEVVNLERGQLVTSISRLEKDWGWSKTKILKYLNLLQKDGTITKKSDKRKTTISICRYGFHANVETSSENTAIPETIPQTATFNNTQENNNSNNVADDIITDFISTYNNICGNIFESISISHMSNRELANIRSTIEYLETSGITPEDYFKLCVIDPLLTGQKDPNFHACFAYIINPSTISRTIKMNPSNAGSQKVDKALEADPIAHKIFNNARNPFEVEKQTLLDMLTKAREIHLSDEEIFSFFETSDLSFTTTLMNFRALLERRDHEQE